MKFLLALAGLATGLASAAASGPVAENVRAEKSAVNSTYVPVKAPRDNLWSKITDQEQRDIISFIGREQNKSM